MTNFKEICFAQFAACSYEGFLFGWKIDESNNDDESDIHLEAKQIFGFNCGAGQLKCLTSSSTGKYLVAGGNDERVHIFNVEEKKSLGELAQHKGAITKLSFYQDSHLFSASEDGNLCIWRVYDWQCLHILGGHKAAVIDMSVHPSGKLAVSISKDGTLKLWNLVQGRCSFTKRLKQPADQVLWHDAGEHYLIVAQRNVQLYAATDNNSVIATLSHSSRVNRAVFASSPLSAGESGSTSSDSRRIITACDNQEINIFNFEGVKTAAVDLSSLGLGRPRDLVLVDGNMKAIRSDVLRQSIISFGGENSSPEKDDSSIESKCTCIAMTTSTGFLALLSLSGIELVGSVSNRATDGDALPVEAVVLAMHHVKGDPRFTALTALNTAHMESKKKIGNGPDISLHGDNPVTEDAAVQLIESNDINGKKRKVQFDEADGDARSGKAMKSTTEKLNRSDRNSLFGKPTVTIIEEDGDQSPQKKTSNSRAKAGKNRKETHDSKSAGNLMRR